MKKIKEKFIKNKPLSIALILCLTVVYLFATASFAQDTQKEFGGYTTDGKELYLYADKLSYGDLWTMSSTEFGKTYYAQTNTAKSTSLYISKDDGVADVKSFGIYPYYGYVVTGDHSGVNAGVPLTKHAYTDFWNNYVYGEIEGVNQSKIPCATVKAGTKTYASYAMVPDSSGTYRIYIYTEDAAGPAGKVRYALVDDYEASNGTAGFAGTAFTASAEFDSFTQVGNSFWWYADVTVGNTEWTAYKVSAAKVTSTSTSAKDDEGGNTTWGSAPQNTLLGGESGTYYYNKWTVTTLKLRTLLVVQWNSDVKLGPVSKKDTITIKTDSDTSDSYGGTLTVTNIFGETIPANGQAQTTAHAPLFVTATANTGSVFAGFSGVDVTIRNGVCEFMFEKTMTASGLWEKYIPLPTVTVTDGKYSGSSTFYSSSVLSPTYTTGTSGTFTVTANFETAPGTKIQYIISEPGVDDRTGTLTASADSLQIPVKLDTVVITLTAVSADEQVNRTCTVTITSVANTTLPLVAKNLQTDKKYRYIEDAIAEAKTGETIVLIGNATFVSDPKMQKNKWLVGDAGYTVDAGVTLLLPYSSSDYTIMSGTSQTNDYKHANVKFVTSNPADLSKIHYSQSVSYTLTVPQGVVLRAVGTSAKYARIVVGGTITCNEGGEQYQGATFGAHANINLGGTLELDDYSVLSAAGFIYGGGSIRTTGANAEIYQPMVIRDWRGAGVAPLFVDTNLNKKVTIQSGENGITPFTQWSTFNIQSDVIISQSNYMYLYAGLRETDVYCSTSVLIGDSNKVGFITLGSGSAICTEYDEITWPTAVKHALPGKTTVRIIGGATFGELQLAVKLAIGSFDIKTSEYTANIAYGYDVELVSGEFIINNSIALLPGMKFTVGKDAILHVGTDSTVTTFMVYDGLLHRVYQVETVEYEDARRDAKNYPTTAELQAATVRGRAMSGDAEFIVNGKLVLGANASFGGVIQTTEYGIIDATAGTSGASVDAKTQLGVVGTGSVNLHDRYCAGMVLYDRTAQLVDVNGNRFDIKRGNIYQGTPYLTSVQETYSFKYYPYASSVKKVVLVGNASLANGETAEQTLPGYTLNETIYGAWGLPMTSQPSLEQVYYLEDYVWFNGVLTIPAFDGTNGSISILAFDEQLQLPFISGSYVSDGKGGYYLVREMEAKSLSQLIDFQVKYVDASGNTYISDALAIDFQKYADAYIKANEAKTDEATKNMVALVKAMKAYGDAAEDYFEFKETETAPDEITDAAKPDVESQQAITQKQNGTYKLSDSMYYLFTRGANVEYAEHLSMIINCHMIFDDPIEGDSKQPAIDLQTLFGANLDNLAKVGLEVQTLDKDGNVVKTIYYVTYGNVDGTFENPSQPTNGGSGGNLLVPGLTKDENGLYTNISVAFDLTSEDYLSRFLVRPYLQYKDGEENVTIYGRQCRYGLEDYIARSFKTGSTDTKTRLYNNLLAATWAYAQAADAAFN